MDTIRPSQLLMPLASVIGLTGLGGGIYSFIKPAAFADTIGLPLEPQNAPLVIPYVSFIGARNLGSGLALLVLVYTGQRKAAGIALMCGVVTAVADSWLCIKYNALDGKAVQHGIMGSFLGVLGYSLYSTE